MPELQRYFEEIRELPCAALLELVARRISAFGDDVETEVGPLGVRFRVRGRSLCELSVFGELFIARVGPRQAVEYRVRNEDIALQALDHVLREYLQVRAASQMSS